MGVAAQILEDVWRQLFFPIVVPHLRIKLPGNCCLIQSQTIEGNDGGRINIIPSLFLGVWLSP